MKHILTIIFIALTFQTAQAQTAEAESVEIPTSMLKMQQMSALQATCQAGWTQMAQENGVLHEKLDDTYELWILPCAHWSVNYDYTVYVTIKESSHPDGFLTKAIRFVNSTPFEGIMSRDVISNYIWDAKTQTLRAEYFYTRSGYCSTRTEYKWNRAQQNFLLVHITKQEDCTKAQNYVVPTFPALETTRAAAVQN